MMARSPPASSRVVPVAIGPLLSAAGGGVAAGAAGLGLGTSAGLSVSVGLGSAAGTWLFAGTSATWLGLTVVVSFVSAARRSCSRSFWRPGRRKSMYSKTQMMTPMSPPIAPVTQADEFPDDGASTLLNAALSDSV